jgi:hypothetical protein
MKTFFKFYNDIKTERGNKKKALSVDFEISQENAETVRTLFSSHQLFDWDLYPFGIVNGTWYRNFVSWSGPKIRSEFIITNHKKTQTVASEL